ncbi:hypothetical protein EYZ11_005814 [Aspergillus tanneri]|uniref:Uncharacterized protein n=1 Tax=Aspergillus tanneri TaxID=1220188 RepID=A0A4S3JH54_9EURO|nr:uncharacterized protein ATNIH1004_009892 [Aspergillus tanneri]KAA8643130.1 hypothetical protein ATNIH1004_009892 [Aspergillus tanneri]THC94703.1 hypothetical protein EYZ11_005814 [Aspergillus tanneri]
MCQLLQAPVSRGPGHFPPPRLESSAPPTPSLESSNPRKRPLFPSDKPPLAPRAIQPRPAAASTASLSSESGASVLVSPSAESVPARGEPPRKRGRPSKAESERRKAAAEARGETYPPPRRSGSNKMKAPSAPTSPAGIESLGSSFAPQPPGSRPANIPRPDIRYAPPAPPAMAMGILGSSDDDRARDIANRDIGPTIRELPRPGDIRQTLPSPVTLQLGHRETIPRTDTGERPFERPPSDRISFTDRRALIHPTSGRPDEPSVSGPEATLRTLGEKRAE